VADYWGMATANHRLTAGTAAFQFSGFRLYQIASFCTVFCTEMQSVAVGWQVYEGQRGSSRRADPDRDARRNARTRECRGHDFHRRFQRTRRICAGLASEWFGAVPAVVLGGVGAIVVTVLWTWIFPELRRADSLSRAGPANAAKPAWPKQTSRLS
jgi:hypothetical protein